MNWTYTDATGRVIIRDGQPAVTDRNSEYRAQVRATMQRFSDQALAFQDSIIRGGIDREECDREIERRRSNRIYERDARP